MLLFILIFSEIQMSAEYGNSRNTIIFGSFLFQVQVILISVFLRLVFAIHLCCLVSGILYLSLLLETWQELIIMNFNSYVVFHFATCLKFILHKKE